VAQHNLFAGDDIMKGALVSKLSWSFVCLSFVALPATAASLAVVNAASYSAALAPGSIATAFGSDLAVGTGAGTTVTVRDSTGTVNSAALLYAYPQQIAFVIAASSALGSATITVTSGDGTVSTTTVQIAAVAPGLFSANATGQGVAAAVAVQGTNASLIFTCGSAPLSCTPVPVNVNQTVLELYGTGIRGHSTPVACTIGGVSAPVSYAGAQSQYAGLDQVNVALPATLANQGTLPIVLTVDGTQSNTVTMNTGAPVVTANFYVAPDGSDSWSGTLATPNANSSDGPFASIARAQQAVRTLRQSSPNLPLTVMLRQGTYYLPLSPTSPGTLNFTQADSGAAAAPLTWQNYPGETPVVSGGEPIGAGGLGLTWTNVGGDLWQVPLPAGMPNFEHLFYNGERRLRSRLASSAGLGYYMSGGVCYSTASGQSVALSSCNLGTFFRIASDVPPTGANASCPSVTNSNDTSQSKCLDRFSYDPNDPIAQWINLNASGSTCGGPASPYPIGDIEVAVFDAWTVDILRVSCLDTTKHIIYFTGPAKGNPGVYDFIGPTAGHRYVVDNTRDAFNAARAAGLTGVWFLDRSVTPWLLSYLANSGENPNTDTVIIPQIQAASSTGGSLVSAVNLSYVDFTGITFEMDAWTIPAAGFGDDENGENTVPAAIDCESCQHVTFEAVTVRHTAASGLQIASASGNSGTAASNDTIQNSAFYDIGSSGIHIGHHPLGSDRAANVVQFVAVGNNVVQGYSRVFADGEGLAQGNGHDISYVHNDVSDGYHAGISICNLGCPSVDFKANGTNILSQYNHIWNVIQGITADGGTLYYNVGLPGGSGTGNRILSNLLHDVSDSSVIDAGVSGSGYGGSGIYLDEQSAGVDVENNVVFRVTGPAIHLTQGPAAGQPGHTFRNNIFALARTGMFDQQQPWPQGCGAAPSPQITLANNLFYFDFDDTEGFYVQRGCADSCGLAYNRFQSFQGNLYWRTDGAFAGDGKAFHVLTRPPAGDAASACGSPANPNSAWTFLTFAQWQTGSPVVNGSPLAMNEDPGGTVSVDPGFGAAALPGDFLLTSNPVSGFDYALTNDTIVNAGRVQPVINPPTVPHTYPTFYFTRY
jgi:uncharacterized protein (TIGR03437 family)